MSSTGTNTSTRRGPVGSRDNAANAAVVRTPRPARRSAAVTRAHDTA